MLLRSTQEPFEDPRWSFEIKMDGWRTICVVTRAGVHVYSRHGAHLTRRFPELQKLRELVREPAVFDGELCALDKRGFPQFEWMQRRDVVHTLVAFDVLRIGSRDVTHLPLERRRSLLERVLVSEEDVIIRARANSAGFALFQQCERLGLEWLVGKRNDSTYKPGIRSAAWLKIKTPTGRRVIRERMLRATASAAYR